jgi:hypothetical protein
MRRAVRVHLPLRLAALCLDCEECFELAADACPGCGSATWVPLARFLDGRPAHPGRAGDESVVLRSA